MQNKPDEVSISKVEISIAGEKLRLTLEQAKELQKILNNTFPAPETKVVPVYVARPVYRERSVPYVPKWDQWRGTCQ
mgnify:CR=1 FL=1